MMLLCLAIAFCELLFAYFVIDNKRHGRFEGSWEELVLIKGSAIMTTLFVMAGFGLARWILEQTNSDDVRRMCGVIVGAGGFVTFIAVNVGLAKLCMRWVKK